MKNRKLTSLQSDFLAAFFRRERRFFLTGGAALSGFHLGHRETHDLDLFTLHDVLDEAAAEVAAVSRELGAAVESLQTAPDFRRFLVKRGQGSILVDLVRDRVAQLVSEKPVIDGIRVDPPEEILANKLCALLSRAEIRDLVDVRALEMAGFPIEEAIGGASQKDTGLTPAQLAWVLNQIRLGEGIVPPGDVSRAELQQYLEELVQRLTKLAFPAPQR